MPTYTAVYPTQDEAHVKTTSLYSILYIPPFATDPAKGLTGTWESQSWLAAYSSITNQRFHIDLGAENIIRRLLYQNGHHYGTLTNSGVNGFTFWGSNSSSAFADLVYSHDTNWTQLTVGQSTLDQHTGSDVADPKYILVTNTVAYRYYAFKFEGNYGNSIYMNVRRLTLMTEDDYVASYVKKFMGVNLADIKKVNTVLKSAIKKISGV